MEETIEALNSGDIEQQLATLKSFTTTPVSESATPELLQALINCINSRSLAVAALSLDAFADVLPELDPSTLPNLNHVLTRSVSLLGQLRADVNRNAAQAVFQISRVPQMLETVLTELLHIGLPSASWHVRQQTLKTIAYLIESDMEFMYNVYEVAKLYQTVLDFVNDQSTLVSIAAKECIKRLDAVNPQRRDTFKRLSYQY